MCRVCKVFPGHAKILTWWETVPHPKFVNEMPETHAYPLNAINTPVYENKIFWCLGWKHQLWKYQFFAQVRSAKQPIKIIIGNWSTLRMSGILKIIIQFVEFQCPEWFHWLTAWILFMRIHVAYLNCQDKFNFIANFYMCGIRKSRSSNWSTGTPSVGNTLWCLVCVISGIKLGGD